MIKEIHIFGFYDSVVAQEEAECNREYIVEQLRFEGVYNKDGSVKRNIVIRDDL